MLNKTQGYLLLFIVAIFLGVTIHQGYTQIRGAYEDVVDVRDNIAINNTLGFGTRIPTDEARRLVEKRTILSEATEGRGIHAHIPTIIWYEYVYGVPSELVVGIANAESSLCENYAYWYDGDSKNCWGMKPLTGEWTKKGSSLRFFRSWDEAVEQITYKLSAYYITEGKDTPEKISAKWVGRYSENWIANVNRYYLLLNKK